MDVTAAQKIRADAKEATRRALLEAGLAETIEGRGAIPSIEAMCKRAGYTRGAFYVHFTDREHFISELLDWILSNIIRALFVTSTEEAADLEEVVSRFTTAISRGEWPDVEQNLQAVYMAVLRELRPGSALRDRHTELMNSIAERLERLIVADQKAGRLRKDVDGNEMAMLLLLIAIGSIMWEDVGIDMNAPALGRSLLKLMSRPR